ncbi:MAG: hypothetical protein LQ340_003260 [Diploschistes diacapsis]|nr:MAG: hypothetical protein LQ340_003260 [Diploschistes diacapsis]
MAALEIRAPQPERPLKRKAEVLHPLQDDDHFSQHPSKKRDSVAKTSGDKEPYMSPPASTVKTWLESLPIDETIQHRKFFSRSDTFLLSMSENTRRSFEMEATPTLNANALDAVRQMPPPPIPTLDSQSVGTLEALAVDIEGSDEGVTIETEALKNAVRQPHYRTVLYDHGVIISAYGIDAPEDLSSFAWDTITRNLNQGTMDNDQLKEIQKVLQLCSETAEDTFREDMAAIFPSCPSTISKGNKRLDSSCLPFIRGSLYRIAPPFCDSTYGYGRALFTDQQRAVILHLWKYVWPSKEGILPFFAVEYKAPCMHGTHWVAENQCAGFGAHRINALKELYALAGIQIQKVEDITVFSCTIDYTLAVFWVHWLEAGERPKYKSREIRTLNLRNPKHLRQLGPAIKAIWHYGLNERLPAMKTLLDRLHCYVAKQTV